MNALVKYYEENLYPLQNGVLSLVSAAKTPFFLTGGTALSRFYTFHRYSDDLDFFVIDDPLYAQHVNTVLQQLSTTEKKGVFNIDRTSMERGKTNTQMHIITPAPSNIELKVEFINDVAFHFGEIKRKVSRFYCNISIMLRSSLGSYTGNIAFLKSDRFLVTIYCAPA